MSSITSRLKLPLAICIAAAALAACSSNNEETPIGAAPAPAPASTEKVNEPLKADEVSASTSVLKGPFYDAANDQVLVTVGVQNKGGITFLTTGTNPVTLGVVQKIPAQNGEPDKRGTDMRAAFKADIKAGSTGEADVILPADFVIGNKVEFDPLQENVVWFGFDLKQPTAVIGPFARCADGKGVCDGQGNPVPSK